MSSTSSHSHNQPDYIVKLQAAYGAPSQAGFGSAVFYEHLDSAGALEKKALEKYQYFVGDLWKRSGKAAWMSKWKQVYARPAQAPRDIVSELRHITDEDAQMSAPMMLDNIENAEAAQQALAVAYDDSSVTELAVYNIGDGEAMSGLLIAGRRASGETALLVFLMD